MIIEQVKEYNIRQKAKWYNDCDKNDSPFNRPQIVFYLFYTLRGMEREFGYVASGNNRAIWERTKKEAIKEYNKSYN